MNVDDISIAEIVLDQSAKNLISARAREDCSSLADAFEKTLIEALHEHMDKHEPRNWWS